MTGPMTDSRLLRLCESTQPIAHKLEPAQKTEIEAAVAAWLLENPGKDRPLSFNGTHGELIAARQYAGIIGTREVTVEIYPKLDAALLMETPTIDLKETNSTLRNLLWMMEVAAGSEAAESGTAGLEQEPTNFFEILAFLLARNLKRELELGLPHEYVRHEDDLRMVRGRLNLLPQITMNWNRWDRLRCAWDEFTPDNPIPRLFKCACKFLHSRVEHSEVARLLENCLGFLDEVGSVNPCSALAGVHGLRWDRRFDRFRRSFDLAQRLLLGTGHALMTGDADTFVFLVDMHQLFQDYTHVLLEELFGVSVEQQVKVGSLFRRSPGGMNQLADYRWKMASQAPWIGDAKYKHLGKQGQPIDEIEEADIRQLTVYAELERLRAGHEASPSLMILFPFVGVAQEFQTCRKTAWNGSDFWLVPVEVKQKDSLLACLPENVGSLGQDAACATANS